MQITDGKLFLVPTPIGNLEDITLRAIRLLKECDLVLAEDTRKAGFLLQHLEISKKMFAHHQHNEHQAVPELLKMLRSGKNICMISDAGTPGISDPGFLLIRECIREGIAFQTLPGATACIPALVNSGLPCDRFCFEGFLPVKKGRQTRFKEMAREMRTMVFYESPHRIVKTLLEMGEYFGKERQISISRELSKVFEETLRGTIAEAQVHFNAHPPKGEFVICVAGTDERPAKGKYARQEEETEEEEEDLSEDNAIQDADDLSAGDDFTGQSHSDNDSTAGNPMAK